MNDISDQYRLILEMNKLKLVFRTTITEINRRESTAEHSWSVSMIALILMEDLKKEFSQIDELKIIKLALIHDVVEIYAGDVIAFDANARKEKAKIEAEALQQLMKVDPKFGFQLHDLWYECEDKKTIEAKIAKAADAICPLFQRLYSKQSYIPFNISMIDLERVKYPHFKFSKTFTALYNQLKSDLLNENLIKTE